MLKGKHNEQIYFNDGEVYIHRQAPYSFIDSIKTATPGNERCALNQLAEYIRLCDGWPDFAQKRITEMFLGRTENNHYAVLLCYGEDEQTPVQHKIFIIPPMKTFNGARYWWSKKPCHKKGCCLPKYPKIISIFKTPEGFYTGLVLVDYIR